MLLPAAKDTLSVCRVEVGALEADIAGAGDGWVGWDARAAVDGALLASAAGMLDETGRSAAVRDGAGDGFVDDCGGVRFVVACAWPGCPVVVRSGASNGVAECSAGDDSRM